MPRLRIGMAFSRQWELLKTFTSSIFLFRKLSNHRKNRNNHPYYPFIHIPQLLIFCHLALSPFLNMCVYNACIFFPELFEVSGRSMTLAPIDFNMHLLRTSIFFHNHGFIILSKNLNKNVILFRFPLSVCTCTCLIHVVCLALLSLF